MTAGTTRLVVGRVRGVHGLRGLVRVEVLTDRPEDRFVVGRVLHREGSDAPLTITSAQPVEDGPGWRLGFREVADRSGADRLREAYLEIAVDRSDLAPGEAWWHEVIGTDVRAADGRSLGKVADVYRAGEAEVYVVRGGPPGDFDLPAVKSVINTFEPGTAIVIDEAALDLAAKPVDAKPKARKAHRWSRHGRGGEAAGAGADEPPPRRDEASQ